MYREQAGQGHGQEASHAVHKIVFRRSASRVRARATRAANKPSSSHQLLGLSISTVQLLPSLP